MAPRIPLPGEPGYIVPRPRRAERVAAWRRGMRMAARNGFERQFGANIAVYLSRIDPIFDHFETLRRRPIASFVAYVLPNLTVLAAVPLVVDEAQRLWQVQPWQRPDLHRTPLERWDNAIRLLEAAAHGYEEIAQYPETARQQARAAWGLVFQALSAMRADLEDSIDAVRRYRLLRVNAMRPPPGL